MFAKLFKCVTILNSHLDKFNDTMRQNEDMNIKPQSENNFLSSLTLTKPKEFNNKIKY